MGQRICIIGDVHGMTDMLRALLQKLDLQPGETLISLGDLVDKGPDPAGTVRYLRELKAQAEVEFVLIKANHEDRHLRYRRNLTLRPKVAGQQAESFSRLPELMAALSEEDWAFLETAVLFHRLPQHNILLVHGGIPGNMQSFPSTPDEVELMPTRHQRNLNQVLRTRHISSEDGRFLSLAKEGEDDPFWAEVYDGRFGHVVFGHQPWFDGPREFAHATGIDTGAVDGGSLTALVLQADGTRDYISVGK